MPLSRPMILLLSGLLAGCASDRVRSAGQDRSDQDIESRINEGKYERIVQDDLDFVGGPPDILNYIRRDSDAGKHRLKNLLDSSSKLGAYFAVIALAQVGDPESKNILFEWATAHVARQRDLAVVIAVRLIWLNDYRLEHLIAKVEPSNRFLTALVLSMARAKFGLTDLRVSEDPKVNTFNLRRVVAFLDDLPPEEREKRR